MPERTTHTAGPWSASSHPDPIGKRYLVHSVPIATGVAHCWTKGDADLIAAAPEMREARAVDPEPAVNGIAGVSPARAAGG